MQRLNPLKNQRDAEDARVHPRMPRGIYGRDEESIPLPPSLTFLRRYQGRVETADAGYD